MNTRILTRVAALVAGAAFLLPLAACGTATESGAPAGAVRPESAVVAADRSHRQIVDTAQASGEQPEAARIQLQGRRNEIGAYISPTGTMQEFLQASLMDVHRYWSAQFAGWGYAQPVVSYEFPATAQQADTRCGGKEPMMQYCPSDNTISISQKTAIDLWEGRYGGLENSGTGDMSVVVLVAHEYGHAIGKQLGFGAISGSAKERLADCLAGTWAQDANRRGILETGDVTEAANGLDLLAEHPELGVKDDLHGTPAQRQEAFAIGWHRGAAACTATYGR